MILTLTVLAAGCSLSSSVLDPIVSSAPHAIAQDPDLVPKRAKEDPFGSSFDAGPDLDHDGCADLVVAATSTGKDAFALAIFYSGKTGKVLGTYRDGETRESFFVRFIGDIDHDGVDDVALRSSAPPLRKAEHITIVSGKSFARITTIDGPSDSSGFGCAFAPLRGSKDAARLVVSGLRAPAGAPVAWIYGGDELKLLRTLKSVGEGEELVETTLDVLGDLDGDGVPEIVLGMGGELLGGKDPGVAIHSGKDGKLLFAVPRGRSPKFGIDAFGQSVHALGDVDGDGRADLLVIASDQVEAGMRACYARVLSGKDGAVLYTFGATDELGTSAYFGGAIGDIDKDARADFVVGRDPKRIVQLISGRTLKPLREWSGEMLLPWERIDAARGGGDIDGDGVPDVLVRGTGAGQGTGGIRAFSGKDGALIREFLQRPE